METPSVSAVFSAAWRGAPALFRSRPKLYWGFLAGGAAVGALALLTPANAFSSPDGPQFNGALVPALLGYVLLAGVAGYFLLADAVRTIVPAFQMTFQVFLLTLLLNMVYSAAVQFAMYAFIIPAFYVAPKMWLLTPNYLLASLEPPDVLTYLSRAWRDTNDLYWPTLGFMLLSTCVSFILDGVAAGIAWIGIQLFAPLAIVLVPLVLAVTLFCVAFAYLGWLLWAVAVRKHADALALTAVAVPV
jgi:hypothetical protein